MHKRGIVRKTILLISLRDASGRLLTDHIWINHTTGFDAEGLFRTGESIISTAFVSEYVKGYFGEKLDVRYAHSYSIDICLNYPYNIQKAGLKSTPPFIQAIIEIFFEHQKLFMIHGLH
jgi:hypothetical protein